MSRSEYQEEDAEDFWALVRWRGAVKAATRGKRGQQLLRDMLAALDAMPVKELIANALVADGKCCALGAYGLARRIDMSKVKAQDCGIVAELFGVAPALVREISNENDDNPRNYSETPAQRFIRMRAWVAGQII